MNWALLIAAIFAVESGGEASAFNEAERAVGPAQIRQCAVDDLNREYGTGYKLEQFYNKKLSRWAVVHYTRMYGADSYEEAARIWVAGPDGPEQKCSLKYWKKIENKLEQLKTRR